MTKTTFTARTPEDLLALVPCVLGFHPESSIVMLTFGTAPKPFHARIDLPGSVDEIDEVVSLLVAPAAQHGAGQAVLVTYAPDTDLVLQTLFHLEVELEEHGVAVVGSLRVHDDRWFWVHPGMREIDPDGVPFTLAAHPFVVQSIFEGKVVHGSRAELAESLVCDDEDLLDQIEQAAFAAATRWREVQPAAEERWVSDVVLRGTTDRRAPSIEDLGRLLVALQDVRFRDVAWTAMDREHATAQVEFWTEVVRRTPAMLLAPPATLLAFAAWLAGHGALAWCALDRAVRAEPDYSLARAIGALLTEAVPPHRWEEWGLASPPREEWGP